MQVNFWSCECGNQNFGYEGNHQECSECHREMKKEVKELN